MKRVSSPVPVPARKPKKGMSDQWKMSLIAGGVIGAVFAGLELTRPTPEEPTIVTLHSKEKSQAGKADQGTVEAPPENPVSPDIPAAEPGTTPDSSKMSAAPEKAPGPDVRETAAFDKEAALVLTGLDAGREDAIRRDGELFSKAIDSKEWTAYRALLARSIDGGLARLAMGQGLNRFDAVWKEPALYQAFLRWQVLGHFSESDISGLVEDSYSGEMLVWLCNNPKAMEELLLTIKPEDNSRKVLEFLIEAWPNIEGKMEKYFPLVLASAVVFDRDVRISNPVAGSQEQKAVVEPMKRLLWFVAKNEKGQLAAPVHHSSANDLIWVVCAPVSTSELEWSLDKMHLSRSHWGNAYGMIEYLMERAVNGLNPYEEYTFAEILKEGGICGDQSYFCANTARAQGIPAMSFSGETNMGPHAWVGLKIKSDEWTTGVGRIGGVSKGQTMNPQTGKQITEQEVQLWSDRAHQSPVRTLAVARHLWLADYFESMGKDEDHAGCVRLANQLGSSFTETWAALFELLRKQTKLTGEPAKPDNLEEWKNFAKSMRLEFKDNPRMAQLAANAEATYIFPYGDDGDAERTLLRERRRIGRDSGEQADLIAESLKREADLILKRGDPEAKADISRLYDSALRKYGGSITGFKMMAQDYFSFFKTDPEMGRKVARDIELAFKRVVETGSKEWFRAKTETSIYRMICGYYRTAGDEDRAVMLEKRYETLMKRAERGAL